MRYAIRLPANDVLERGIEDLLTRPRGRPSHAALVRYRSFEYQAASWERPRRVIAKIERHLGELFPRVGFYRHHADRDEPGCRPLLQPAWDGGAMDRGTLVQIGVSRGRNLDSIRTLHSEETGRPWL